MVVAALSVSVERERGEKWDVIAFKVDPDLMARLKRLAEAMGRLPEFENISRHRVARIALKTPGSLDALELKYLPKEPET